MFRVVAAGVLAYGALVAMLQISSNRTLSTMNAFGIIVTVTLVEGPVALALLIDRWRFQLFQNTSVVIDLTRKPQRWEP